jgi:23S rRNA (guanosine2251-2'-O)-methyltransferase
MFLILHNIRSEENVGSMFRTADGFGITKIYLTGYTPDPLDRFKREVGKIAKTALGAEKSVPWEHIDDVTECIAKLKQEGVRIVALEQDPNSNAIANYAVQKPFALIVGNEVGGVEGEVLKLVDDIVEIPMLGVKESLNVSVATGIALYALTQD